MSKGSGLSMQSYRAMLITLDGMVRPDELDKMKFMCKDLGLGAKLRERIMSCVQLFEALEERKQLGPDNLENLKRLLHFSTNGRCDMLDLVTEFESVLQHSVAGQERLQAADADLSEACFFVEENLGREYLMVLRRCGIAEPLLEQLQDQYPRNVRELIHEALKSWKTSLSDPLASKDILIKALRSQKRNDLANKIQAGTY